MTAFESFHHFVAKSLREISLLINDLIKNKVVCHIDVCTLQINLFELYCVQRSMVLFFTSFQTHNERIELKVLIYLSFDLIKELTSYNSAPSFIYIIRRKVRANNIFKQFNNSFRSFEESCRYFPASRHLPLPPHTQWLYGHQLFCICWSILIQLCIGISWHVRPCKDTVVISRQLISIEA